MRVILIKLRKSMDQFWVKVAKKHDGIRRHAFGCPQFSESLGRLWTSGLKNVIVIQEALNVTRKWDYPKFAFLIFYMRGGPVRKYIHPRLKKPGTDSC